MRKVVLLSLLSLMIIPVLAQSNQPALVVSHSDGTQTRIELASRPNVSFSTDSVKIVSTSLTLKYAVKDVSRFTYENVGSGLSAAHTDATYRRMGDNLYFNGISSAKQIGLFTMDGRQLPVQLQAAGNGFCLPLSTLPSGIYLLQVNGRTAKILKK